MDNQNVNIQPPEIKNEPLPEVTRRDYIFLVIFFIVSLLAAYFTCGYGLSAGFAVASSSLLLCALIYLKGKMHFGIVQIVSLITSFILIISFFVHAENEFAVFKFLFLLFSVSVFFISACGFDKKYLDRFGIIFSPFFLLFNVCMPNIPKTARAAASKKSGLGSKLSKILIALMCVLPLAILLVSLLMSADVAFENFVISFDLGSGEFLTKLFWGLLYFVIAFAFVFTVSKGLYKEEEKKKTPKQGIDSLYINTMLCVVALIYLVFIVTQLSYIFSGFAGLLPSHYTYSQYARRGFFEMCLICVINLAILAISHACVKRDGENLTFMTRLLSVFISGFSIFLVFAAIAKMFMYIQSYGLTFLRLGTSLFMLFMFVVFVAMIIKTFKIEFRHIRVMIVAACIIMSISAMFDPHAIIAKYNLYAYENGMHNRIDLYYLYFDCGDYGIEPLIKLANESDAITAGKAKDYLKDKHNDFYYRSDDENKWQNSTLASINAQKLLTKYYTEN
ncbi:MAG: DUF4173 domain-containing protein [Clostridia bacterium]|nr:DUF4173 domain-containing protein [Clostridia bacterium]MBQ6892954.1 DUF4173 domain-containing protein [Clostridia bacterium]